jgi:hypothetical protein
VEAQGEQIAAQGDHILHLEQIQDKLVERMMSLEQFKCDQDIATRERFEQFKCGQDMATKERLEQFKCDQDMSTRVRLEEFKCDQDIATKERLEQLEFKFGTRERLEQVRGVKEFVTPGHASDAMQPPSQPPADLPPPPWLGLPASEPSDPNLKFPELSAALSAGRVLADTPTNGVLCIPCNAWHGNCLSHLLGKKHAKCLHYIHSRLPSDKNWIADACDKTMKSYNIGTCSLRTLSELPPAY